jgi:hypothetical protein
VLSWNRSGAGALRGGSGGALRGGSGGIDDTANARCVFGPSPTLSPAAVAGGVRSIAAARR